MKKRLRLTYAIAPPNRTTPPERRAAIAARQSERIAALPVDALLVYDVQDEAVRNGAPRPFPFVPKVDPLEHAFDALQLGSLPRVVYRAVGGQNEHDLSRWLDRLQARDGSAVFVGAPSRRATPLLELSRALALCQARRGALDFGGVVIPERHRLQGAEDARVWAKQEQGCSFFVSQTVWSVAAARHLLRALALRAEREGTPAAPILFTFSPCGSPQTLQFLDWLGVAVPEPVRRELLTAKDMLTRSVELATDAFAELCDYAQRRGLEVGGNVESLTARSAEVDASVELVQRLHRASPRASAPECPTPPPRASSSTAAASLP